MNSSLVLLLLLVLQDICSPYRFTLSRYMLNSCKTSSKSRNDHSYPAFDNRAGLNKSEVWMSTSFDEFRMKAQDILPKNADSEMTSLIALHLMKSEFEFEKKLELQKIESEFEKKMELKKMTFEFEKKLRKSDNKHRLLTAFHSKQLSAVVDLYVNLFVILFPASYPIIIFYFALCCCHTVKLSRGFWEIS
jgi:hypothetical protein